MKNYKKYLMGLTLIVGISSVVYAQAQNTEESSVVSNVVQNDVVNTGVASNAVNGVQDGKQGGKQGEIANTADSANTANLTGEADSVSTAKSTAKTTRTVISPTGESYEIPINITRVAPSISSVGTLTAMLGADKIVASIEFSPFFQQVFPKYNLSNPKNLNVGNIEEVIEAMPQVVYGPTLSDSTLAHYKAAGIVFIPVNVFNSIEDIQNNVNFVASILGGDAIIKAEKYQKYFNDNMEYVGKKGALIPTEEREKIMYVRYKGTVLESSSNKDIAARYIKLIGADNAMQSFDLSIGISAEDIIGSQASIIFINSNDGKNELMNNPALQTVPAVRDNKIYVVPTGIYLWSVRTEETALMPLWLASNIYPEVFPEINMEKEVFKFYQEFYDYTLSDKDVKKILTGM